MMVGKNNKTVQLEKSATRRSKYSIKKLSVGVVSVAVGATLSLGLSTVHAEEVFVETSETSTADSIDQTFEVANHNEEIELSDDAISDETDHEDSTESVQINSPQVDLQLFPAESEEVSVTPLHEDNESVIEVPVTTAPEISLENSTVNTQSNDYSENSNDESSLNKPQEIESLNKDTITNESLTDDNAEDYQVSVIEITEDENNLTRTSEFLAQSTIDKTEIIDLYLEKDTYAGSEEIKAVLKVKNDTEITGAYINYGNTTSHEYARPTNSDVTYLDSNLYDFGSRNRITKDGSGNFIIEFLLGEDVNQTIYSFAPGQFILNNLTLYSENERVFHDPDGSFIDSSFFYKQYESQELVKADFEETPFDTRYTTNEDYVRDGANGANYYYSDGSQYTKQPTDEVRLYDYVDKEYGYLTFYLPNYDLETGLSQVTQLGENGIVRYFYNEFGREFDYITIQSSVDKIIEYGASKEAELEEQKASKFIQNKIDVVDIDTGHRITSIEFEGYGYYNRMIALIDQLNNTFGYNLTSEYAERISSNPHYDIFNGQYIELIEEIFYVKNHEEKDIRDYDLPLIPDWQLLYANTEHTNGVLNILSENETLVTFNFDGLKSVDQLIKDGLALLDDKKYYFEKFEYLTPSPNTMSTPRSINVFVRERLKKTLTEEAFGTDYTNDPSEVRDGQNGTKYVYSDGSERIATPPINKIILVDTELSDSLIIDSISVDKEKYAINDNVEVTIVGRSKAAIKDLTIDFSDWSKRKMHYVRGNTSENITHEDGVFTSKVLINIHDYVKNSNFTFDNLIAKDIYGNVTEFWTKWESLDDEPYFNIIDEPFQVGFKTTDVTLLGVNPVEFDTEYTTDENLIREGINGSKLVYSDGSEVILTDAVSEVVLYDNEVAEIEPDTEFTIYTHEVRAGIKGSKLVFSNGEERVLEAPVSAIALYQNKVEEFDYTTLTVESSDMAYGDRRIIQEGILGRRAVFYDAEGNIVDSLIVSAPVSRIEQVGANKQTLVLTPFDTEYTTDSSLVRSGQNGTKYIYSDGREEQLTEAVSAIQLYRYADEIVAFKEITQDNSQLVKGETKVIVEGQPGLNRVFYDESGKVIEVQIITKGIDQVMEIGTLDSIEVVDEDKELPDNPTDSDNDNQPEESSSNDNNLPDESSGNDNESLPDESQEEDNKPSTPSIEEDSSENEKIDDSIKPNDSNATLNAASVLPNTGEHPSSVWLTLGAVSLLSGFGLIATGKRKSTEE